MISESSIALAEPIAVAGFDIKPSAIIMGFDGESYGLKEYGDNFREEIVATTGSQDSLHTEYMKEGSARMAEIIRTTLSNIGEYGKPLAMAVAKAAKNCYSRNELKTISMQSFYHSFFNLDDPFFDSPLFPKEVKEQGLAFVNVSLDALKVLTFDAPTKEEIFSFIGTQHADVVEAIRTRDHSMEDAVYTLCNFSSLEQMFVKGPNGNFDFSKIKSMDSEKLIKCFILLTRMYASEEIPSWFKNGELSKYREYVNLLWNGMTCYLLKLKENVSVLRSRKMVLVDRAPLALKEAEGSSGAMVISADVICYYTEEALETITAADCSMSEVLLGYYWEKVQGRTPLLADLVNDPIKFQKAAEDYFRRVHEKFLTHARNIFIESAAIAIENFVLNNPLVLERLAGKGQTAGTWVRARFLGELEKAYYSINQSHPDFGSLTADSDSTNYSMEDVIMSTRIVPLFLREIGCDMAADILEDTFISQTCEDTVIDKKTRLAEAVIAFIARKCFV